MKYTPSKEILQNYAHVMIDFALGEGKGIKAKEVVYLQFDAEALPLALEVYKRIVEKGAYPIVKQNEEEFSRIFYAHAQNHQLDFFPEKYMKSLVDLIDHRLYLIAERDPFLLKNVDPAKLMRGQEQRQKMKKWLFDKEDRGGLTWSLCLYGTEGLAKESGLTLKKFWDQIIDACYLDQPDPVASWKKVSKEIELVRTRLSALPIDKLHITANKTDLWITMGEKRKFLSGGGHNIPSFEIFTSPDWRGTEGHIFFDYPLYRYGNLITDIMLEFKNGRVVKATASKNEKLLKEMIKQKNADKIGEYSLTDHRHSRITKFMANTLYDENFSGKWGNTHLAVGSSYHDAYTGSPKGVSDAQWEKLGFNESVEHCDIIATTKRTVEAHMKNGTTKIIYKDGEFLV